MGDKTGIQWTEATWNPVTGCTKVSPGCAHCYAEQVTHRFANAWGVSGKPWTPANAGEVVRTRPDRLDQPLRWQRPRTVFVNSMSDLFHDQVPPTFVEAVYGVMARCPQHTFQILTKRPELALDWYRGGPYLAPIWPWPLPNVWLGVSIENARHTYRADVLREIPAAVRFISAEPLLGQLMPVTDDWPERPPRTLCLDGIDWVIVGGESGPRARPMQLDWALELVNVCRAAGVACFVKQLGTHAARELDLRDRKGGRPEEWPAPLRVREMPA
ncbi:MAG: phage Gp37/Gp68 family protein [Thermoleophilia bacterium]